MTEPQKIIFELNESELRLQIKNILELILPYRICLLIGEMGSGKTTFVRNLAEQLGDQSEASSPSYAIANEYIFKKNEYNIHKLFHLDLYRLESLEEILDTGITEILFNDHHCMIEWPELVLPLLKKENMAQISIEQLASGKRKYTINKIHP